MNFDLLNFEVDSNVNSNVDSNVHNDYWKVLKKKQQHNNKNIENKFINAFLRIKLTEIHNKICTKFAYVEITQNDVTNYSLMFVNNKRHKITISNIIDYYNISKYFKTNSMKKLYFIYRSILNIDNIFKSQAIEFIHN